MRFRVLGPVEVDTDDGRVLTLPRRQERCLLAILLLEAGRVVPVDRLLDLLWEDSSPQRPHQAIRSYISRIRRMLAQAAAGGQNVEVNTHRGGYLLNVDPDLVDAHRFRRLLDQAVHTGDVDSRDRLLREALALWRGPALDRAASDRLRQRLCADLDEQHLQAVEMSLATGLELGRHRALLPELARLGAEHPARERLVELHMLALYGDGRTAEALDAFHRARTRLADELGVDPGPELQRVHRAILRGEPVLGEIQAAVQVRVQDRLPDDLADFTGRTAELDRLRQALRPGHEAGNAVVIWAIEGMPGVGKTQLAVHTGHMLAREQPFARVLFVNLRGFHPDPAQPPAEPAAVLDSFLRLLGVPGQQIPHELAARAAMFRQRLAGTRALVVLDNAANEDQVRPLLPDSPDCLTLVTSRRRLTDLHQAMHLAVDVFTPDEALEFLKRAVPDVPVGDDPDALDRVAQRCGHLALALGLLAGQMRTTSGWTVTDHADRLDERYRGRRIDGGVELALDLSYQYLPAERRRLFRLLALHPGPDLDGYAAAALTDTDLPTARDHLQQLCREHLLQQPIPGRYVFHDLVRAYAAERATDEERPPVRRAALTHLFDHYLYAAATAMDTLVPAEQHRRPRIPQPATSTPSVADPAAARAWLDTERTNLTTAAVHAAAHGWPDHTTRLAATLSRYLDTGGHFSDAIVLHTHAGQAAHHTGDREAEAHALTNLGNAHGRLGRFRQAVDHHQQAYTLFREIGDVRGQARTLNNLGTVHWFLGSYRQAAGHHQQAVTLYHQIGDPQGEARALSNLGDSDWRLGSYRQAAEHYHQALTLCREIGDRFEEALALNNLGALHERLGRYQQAADDHRQALTIARAIGNRMAQGYALNGLGFVYRRYGCHWQAADHHRQALSLFREIGDRGGEAGTLNALGITLLADGKPDQAHTQHTTALALANQIGDRYEQARAHDGLAHTHHATGQTDHARHHWQQALAIYTKLGVPETHQVQADLTALGAAP